MVTSNFYKINGGCLPANHQSYITRQADRDLYQNLIAGKLCYVLNCRQMGKSSLRLRTVRRLKQLSKKMQSPILCPQVDILAYGDSEDPSHWYISFIYDLIDSLKLSKVVDAYEWWNKQKGTPSHRLRLFIEQILLTQTKAQVIIFVDEIDSITSHNFNLDEFFHIIRYFYDHRANNRDYQRLNFAIFGVASPLDLMEDNTTNPFNIAGCSINLAGFTTEEAIPLQRGLEGQVKNPKHIIEQILSWTGGQPFLTQKLCYLAAIHSDKKGLDIEKIVHQQIVSNWEEKDNPSHFRSIRNRVLNQQHTVGILDIYHQLLQGENITFDSKDEQQKELRLSGLATEHDGKLKIFNQVYAEIFNKSWVVTELDKLRPYSHQISAWIRSKKKDSSHLLQGQKLQNAQDWASERILPSADYQFLEQSQSLRERRITRRVIWINIAIILLMIITAGFTTWQVINARHNKSLAEKRSEEIKETLNKVTIELSMVKENRDQAQRELQEAISNRDQALKAEKVARITSELAAEQERQAKNRRHVAEIGIQLEHKVDEALAAFKSDQINGLRQALKAGFELQELVERNQISAFQEYPVTSPVFALQQILSNIWSTVSLRVPENSVNQIQFSQNGDYILVVSTDKTVKLLNTSGQVISEFSGHKSEVNSANFNPQDSRIITTSSDDTARIWNLSGNLIQTLKGHKDIVHDARYSHDGEYIVTASADKTARLWTASGEHIATLEGHQAPVFHASFSHDGRYIATASHRGTIAIWNLSGQLLLVIHNHENLTQPPFFSPDGRFLITVSYNASLKLWNWMELLAMREERGYSLIEAYTDRALGVFRNAQAYTMSLDDTIYDIQTSNKISSKFHVEKSKGTTKYNPHKRCQTLICDTKIPLSFDSQFLIETKLGDFHLAELLSLSGDQITVFRGHQGSIRDIKFSHDNKHIITSSEDGTIRIWDLSGQQVSILRGHPGAVKRTEISPDGQHIVSLGEGDEIRIWQLGRVEKSLINIQDCNRSIPECLTWTKLSPGYIITSNYDQKSVDLWDSQGRHIRKFENHEGDILAAQFDRNMNQYLVASSSESGQSTRIWDFNGNTIATLREQDGRIKKVKFSSNGEHIFTISNNETLRLWNNSGEQIVSFTSPTSRTIPDDDEYSTCEFTENTIVNTDADFNFNNQFLAMVLRSDEVQIVDLSGKEVARLKGDQGCINQIQFSPVSNLLVIAGSKATVTVWDLDSRQKIASLDGHIANVVAADFSPNGQYIIIKSQDGTIRIWDLEGNKLVDLLEDCGADSVNRSCMFDAKFSPDSQTVVTASEDGGVNVWDLRGRLLARFLDRTSRIETVNFSPDGKSIVIEHENSLDFIPFQHLDELLEAGCHWLSTSEVENSGKETNILSSAFFNPKIEDFLPNQTRNTLCRT